MTMPRGDGPYRPPPPSSEADADLARRAAEGARLQREADASLAVVRTAGADRNVRVAVGAHFGTPLRTVPVVLAVLLATATVALYATGPSKATDPDYSSHWSLTMLALMGAGAAFFVRLFIPPVATRARVTAERAWATSLPFALDGYFDVLAAEPVAWCALEITLAWENPTGAPGVDTVQAIFGTSDTAAKVQHGAGAGTVGVRSDVISGSTGISSGSKRNPVYVYRNHRFVAYTHRLVDEVLLPLHRSHAIARVSMGRA
jgi:hypothetical protein